jgi:NDP-sugar pyrophosphorylase family protein
MVFEKGFDNLHGLITDEDSSLLSLNFLGKPLVIHNIEKITSTYRQINSIFLPAGMSSVADTIANVFPDLGIKEYEEGGLNQSWADDSLKIPTNTVVTRTPAGECEYTQMKYPWDIGKVMARVLETEVRTSRISVDTSVAESTTCDGPCVIESGVHIDNNCKIKGPLYIGRNTKIGMNSLIRNSMVGKDCAVGFSCEIGKSYLAGHVTIPHLDVILDSVIGQNTWMGAFVGTTNMMLNYKNVMYKLDGQLIDTGLQHFGAIIGHDCTISAGTIILPGRYMPPGTFASPNSVFSSGEKTESKAGS